MMYEGGDRAVVGFHLPSLKLLTKTSLSVRQSYLRNPSKPPGLAVN